MIAAVWAYRDFVFGSVKREFQSKYRTSLLGSAWVIINPLAMILVYTIVFSKMMHNRMPGVSNSFGYSIYLCSGLLTWGLFAEIVGRSQTVFLDNANLIKKISFPRLSLPAIIVINACINFTIIFGLFTAFLIVTKSFPGVTFLALFPVLAIEILFSIGLGMCLGILNVFFRDVGQFFGVVLQFWFWLTPIAYPATALPKWIHPFLSLNPMAGLVAAYQQILVNACWPNWTELGPVILMALALSLWGWRLFRKHSGEIVDEL